MGVCLATIEELLLRSCSTAQGLRDIAGSSTCMCLPVEGQAGPPACSHSCHEEPRMQVEILLYMTSDIACCRETGTLRILGSCQSSTTLMLDSLFRSQAVFEHCWQLTTVPDCEPLCGETLPVSFQARMGGIAACHEEHDTDRFGCCRSQMACIHEAIEADGGTRAAMLMCMRV